MISESDASLVSQEAAVVKERFIRWFFQYNFASTGTSRCNVAPSCECKMRK